MRKNLVSVLMALVVVMAFSACSRELKPKKLGVFTITNAKIADWKPVSIDEELTAEGFILPYFNEEVTTIIRYPSVYIILNGDYKPLGLRFFVWRNGRYEEEGSMGLITDALQTQQFKGEKQMYKVKLTRELKPGMYVMDVQQVEGRLLRFAFKVP